MKVFVGYGYNDRDKWIEDDLFPILRCAGFTVVHGKAMEGEEIDDEVRSRIEQSDAVIGFFTLREGQEAAEFNSHIWVRDELVYALNKKPILAVREKGTRVPDAILGNRQYITLDQANRLACVAQLMKALGERNIRRLRLEPSSDALHAKIWTGWRRPHFQIRYRTRNLEGLESAYREGHLELFEQGFYLTVTDVPEKAYVDVEGLLKADLMFSSGWVSADAVHVRVS